MNNTTPTTCIMCEHSELAKSTEDSTFSYGVGKNETTLHATTDLFTCSKCGFVFTSDAGAFAEHNAICKHLGRLNPLEILSLRQKLDLTQEQFGNLTKFNPSSIHRWETGEKIQNASSDQMLRLIVKVFEKFDCNVQQTLEFLEVENVEQDKYTWSVSEKERIVANAFELRLAA